MTWRAGLPALLVSVLAGCGLTSTETADESPTVESSPPAAETAGTRAPSDGDPLLGRAVTIDLDERPFRLYIPTSYDPAVEVPLVVLLHGYTVTSADADDYFGLAAEADARGFLYALPEGTANSNGDQFWNATAACCDFENSGVDDSAYLRTLIETIVSAYPVDRSQIYLVGQSNGGFMAYRVACEHAEVVAAVVSLAGYPHHDPSWCTPSRPVSVLHIHGTNDGTIPYEGGRVASQAVPSAAETTERWRELNGCDDASESLAPLDIDSDSSGAETTVSAYSAGCRAGSRVELWTITDGAHSPGLNDDFAPAVLDFLYERVSGDDGR